MSGINELKNKTKISLDEMYEDQASEKQNVQKDKSTTQQSSKTTKKSLKNENMELINTPLQKKEIAPTHPKTELKHDFSAVNPNIPLDSHFLPNQESRFPSSKQQPYKLPTYKMTFTLSESIYKAFNDLYAKRMLQGRKTEKTELICEAIKWLIKMEDKQSEDGNI
jgi:hypothetical protein